MGLEDHLMKNEVRELMCNNNNNDCMKSHIEELIVNQSHKKMEKELNDWKGSDIEDLDQAISYTFDTEEKEKDSINLPEIETIDEEEEERENQAIYIDLDDENSGNEDNCNEVDQVGMIKMADDFNAESEAQNKNNNENKNTKTDAVKVKVNKQNNQSTLFSFWRK